LKHDVVSNKQGGNAWPSSFKVDTVPALSEQDSCDLSLGSLLNPADAAAAKCSCQQWADMTSELSKAGHTGQHPAAD
jgi:hypothetical protein